MTPTAAPTIYRQTDLPRALKRHEELHALRMILPVSAEATSLTSQLEREPLYVGWAW